MSRIYLVRHGQKDAGDKYFIGMTDTPLSDKGRQEAECAGKWLSENADDASFYSSPLSRCIETSCIIARYFGKTKEDIRILYDLHEIDLGLWEKMSHEEIRAKYPELFEERGRDMWNFVTPGGESFKEAGRRFLDAVSSIKDDGRDIIVTAHLGVILAACSYLKGMDRIDMVNDRFPGCGITIVERDNGKMILKEQGITPWNVPAGS